MAYYDALTAAWNSTTQPPAGVTGAPLTSGMTTQQKIDTINAWTVTGEVPKSFYVTGDQLLNCINYSEFKNLTPAQESNILAVCQTPGQILGGSGNVSKLAPGMFLDYFGAGSQTIAALTALAKAVTETWCVVNGYPNNAAGTAGGLTLNDAENAGLV